MSVYGHGQCLSSVNPVGGTESLLVLEKNAIRIISFYKYGQGKAYYTKNKKADFDLIEKACYNYFSVLAGYGINNKLTLETEAGYYFNKSQTYNVEPKYTLTGKGLSNLVLLAKVNLYTNHVKRIYFSFAAGPRIPFKRGFQTVNNVLLPIELQPSAGAYGLVLNSSFVKENSEKGLRCFITNRTEINGRNRNNYRPGTSIFTSAFISKHLMFQWLKGDWTTILQLRNEIRTRDKMNCCFKESSGGTLLFLVPQLNYVMFEKWSLSAMIDIPVYQYFNGTQLGASPGLTISLSRVFKMQKNNES
jgi:hypothetical protein